MSDVILLENIELDAEAPQDLKAAAAGAAGIPPEAIESIEILRQSIDARNRRRICRVYTVAAAVAGLGPETLSRFRKHERPTLPVESNGLVTLEGRPMIIGMGPAGLFAALALVERGHSPVIFEQGKAVEERDADVAKLLEKGRLDPASNIMFGEGGAGTYSDGKLTARSGNPYKMSVFDLLVECGADPAIRYLARPHLGTDKLKTVLVALRKKLAAAGAEIRFSSQLTGIECRENKLTGIRINGGLIETSNLFLCCGLSSDPAYRMLAQNGARLAVKGFAAGIRIEHPREFIDEAIYSDYARRGTLSGAEYYLTAGKNVANCYSFCMCPGGVVVPAAWRDNTVLTNGMSLSARNDRFSNSALSVPVPARILGNTSPLDLLALRESWERKAFERGGGGFIAPYQKASEFISNSDRAGLAEISYRPGGRPAPLSGILPAEIEKGIKEAIAVFDGRIKGFSQKGVLIGCETTVSSPVRIVRSEHTFEAQGIAGIFPLGEGAGYSGGIISSACDGYAMKDVIRRRG